MSTFDKLTDRVLSLFGLDLDLSLSLARDPFNAITEDLYLGGRPGPKQVQALEEAGITHVVSCLLDDDRGKVAFLEDRFETLFVPLRDGIDEDVTSVFPIFFEFVAASRRDRGAKVLVHCEAGVSRSATLATALVMQRSRKRFFEAYGEVRTKRHEALPNIGFASQLQRLELEMHPEAVDGVSSLARYLREVCMVPVDVETLEAVLRDHDYDAARAIRAIFEGEIPRVVQGVRR